MEKEQYIDVKNYIRQKNGLYYAVMVYTNVRGERKEKWFPTKLPVKGNKTKAETFLCYYKLFNVDNLRICGIMAINNLRF